MFSIVIGASMVFMTGNDWMARCSDGRAGELWCIAYATGVSDFMATTQDAGITKKMFCLPSEATAEQARDVALKAIKEDPASRAQSAAGLIASSLMTAFPCR